MVVVRTQNIFRLMNPTVLADQLKREGNIAFSSLDFDRALLLYTDAIAVTPKNHLLYSNRASTHICLKQYDKAVKDAIQCTTLDPSFAKGWSRLGQAYGGLGQKSSAKAAFERVLSCDPSEILTQETHADLEKLKTRMMNAPSL
jgi:stress-induced-phosphoprotein 1